MKTKNIDESAEPYLSSFLLRDGMQARMADAGSKIALDNGENGVGRGGGGGGRQTGVGIREKVGNNEKVESRGLAVECSKYKKLKYPLPPHPTLFPCDSQKNACVLGIHMTHV